MTLVIFEVDKTFLVRFVVVVESLHVLFMRLLRVEVFNVDIISVLLITRDFIIEFIIILRFLYEINVIEARKEYSLKEVMQNVGQYDLAAEQIYNGYELALVRG